MILCSGEALIDMLPCTTAGGEPAFRPVAGGAVFNTAIALGRLGVPVALLPGLSTDLFGRMLGAALSDAGVQTGLVAPSNRPTTLAFVTFGPDGQPAYSFRDEGSANRMIGPADLPTTLPDAVQAVFCGGISLAAEPCGTAHEALFLRAARDRVTMLDPNIRPAFVRDGAALRARLGRMIAAADIVKLSDEDARWLLAEDLPPAEAARRLLAAGPRLVALTAGAAGAWAVTAEACLHQPARPVAVVDTVGAGDTFNAGLLAGLRSAGALHKAALAAVLPATVLQDALSLAARAASVTVSRAGANPPFPHELPQEND